MRKLLRAFIVAAVAGGTVWAATTLLYDRNYAQDRSEIEDLQARYLFALDWQNPGCMRRTFTPDGVLV